MPVDPSQRAFPILERQPYPLMFVTISGSHLYGFPSANSDWDLRGVHIAPLKEVLSVHGIKRDTVEDKMDSTFEDELVTHDAAKYFKLLLKNNGYVLEQIFSPLVVLKGPHLEELRLIAKGCITSNHHLHYKGFGYGEWKRFTQKPTKTVKRILYIFRVFMTGIYLMRTGRVEANILHLNDEMFHFDYIDKLVEEKLNGCEESELVAKHTMAFFEREYLKLELALEQAAEVSKLPKEPAGERALNDLLYRMRILSANDVIFEPRYW